MGLNEAGLREKDWTDHRATVQQLRQPWPPGQTNRGLLVPASRIWGLRFMEGLALTGLLASLGTQHKQIIFY